MIEDWVHVVVMWVLDQMIGSDGSPLLDARQAGQGLLAHIGLHAGKEETSGQDLESLVGAQMACRLVVMMQMPFCGARRQNDAFWFARKVSGGSPHA